MGFDSSERGATTMQYRELGATGVMIPEVGLGNVEVPGRAGTAAAGHRAGRDPD